MGQHQAWTLPSQQHNHFRLSGFSLIVGASIHLSGDAASGEVDGTGRTLFPSSGQSAGLLVGGTELGNLRL